MTRPLIEIHDDNSSGLGLEFTITRRWSHLRFWTRGRGIDIYTGELADDMRQIIAEAEK